MFDYRDQQEARPARFRFVVGEGSAAQIVGNHGRRRCCRTTVVSQTGRKITEFDGPAAVARVGQSVSRRRKMYVRVHLRCNVNEQMRSAW